MNLKKMCLLFIKPIASEIKFYLLNYYKNIENNIFYDILPQIHSARLLSSLPINFIAFKHAIGCVYIFTGNQIGAKRFDLTSVQTEYLLKK